MSLVSLKVGDRVRHPGKPEWGPGETLPGTTSDRIRVYFAFEGEKLLKGVTLEPVVGPDAHHPLLDHRIQSPTRGAKRRSIGDLKREFLRLFPEAFADPHYLSTERDYKVAAHRLAVEKLSVKDIRALLKDGRHDEVCARAISVVNATNIIFPNEKMALRDGLTEASPRKQFAEALVQLLYGPGSFKERFTKFSDLLLEIGAPKWTIVTYFPFLVFPQEHMFLKPVVTQLAAETCDFELNYKPDLNWLTYESTLELARTLTDSRVIQ